MRSKTKWGVTVAVMAMMGMPAVVSAQVESVKDFQVADAKDLKDQFVGLAEAFPEDNYDWRPMEGVRSVKEVVALAVAEANLFPSMWGATAPSGIGQGFGGEMERVGAMSKADMLSALGAAFDHLGESLDHMDDATRMADGTTFGRSMTNAAGIAMAMADMHEHLGQLIAYARTNEIVPPWSRGDGMN